MNTLKFYVLITKLDMEFCYLVTTAALNSSSKKKIFLNNQCIFKHGKNIYYPHLLKTNIAHINKVRN